MFESLFYESSVGRVHYIDEGAGIPILLLHGNPTWSFLYRKIVSRRDWRCCAAAADRGSRTDRGHPSRRALQHPRVHRLHVLAAV